MSVIESWHYLISQFSIKHDLSQDLETGCPKLTIVKFLGIHFSRKTKIAGWSKLTKSTTHSLSSL